MKALRAASEPATREILRHWQEAVPNDRLAHLVKHAARSFARALQMRLAVHSVSYGHWSFLRILWESEGLTQRQLSGQQQYPLGRHQHDRRADVEGRDPAESIGVERPYSGRSPPVGGNGIG